MVGSMDRELPGSRLRAGGIGKEEEKGEMEKKMKARASKCEDEAARRGKE